MSHRNATPEDFVGKTITHAEVNRIDSWRLRFSDGTSFAIKVDRYSEDAGPGMSICNECTMTPSAEYYISRFLHGGFIVFLTFGFIIELCFGDFFIASLVPFSLISFYWSHIKKFTNKMLKDFIYDKGIFR